MAGFFVEGIDGLLDQFDKLQNIETIAPKMLEGAAPIVVDKMKSSLQQHRQTGEMIKSIKPSKPSESKRGGHYLVVRPTGSSKTQVGQNGKTYTRKKPERNMEKLAILEFGSSKQKATPVVEGVVKASSSEVLKKMEEIYYQEVDL